MNRTSLRVALSLGLLTSFAAAHAQANRSWVSGLGDDNNQCSRTAPCKTFAGAQAKTNAGGEIDALDGADFRAVTITKALTIDAAGTLAGIYSASGSSAITISAGAGDSIVLRGLTFNTNGAAGGAAITVVSAGTVQVEGSSIGGFANGIAFNSSGQTLLTVSQSKIRDCNGGIGGPGAGLLLNGGQGATTVLKDVEVHNCGNAIMATGGTLTAADVVLSYNGVGICANGNAFSSFDRTLISLSSTAAVQPQGSSVTQFNASTIVANPIGIQSGGTYTGEVDSYGNNAVKNNIVVGNFTTTYGLR